MKKIILSISFSAFSLFGFSQLSSYTLESTLIQLVDEKSSELNKLTGSPYYEDKFTPGVIVENDKIGPNLYFRYDVSKDQIEIKVAPDQEETYILPRSKKFSFKLKDYTYILEQYRTLNGDLLQGYVLSYYNGEKVIFIGKPVATIIPAEVAQTGYTKDKPARIDITLNYYLGIDGANLSEVSLKEKDLKKLLGNSPEMKKYFSDYNIKEINDVVKMLQYYDSIK